MILRMVGLFLLTARLAGAQALPIDHITPPWSNTTAQHLADISSDVTVGVALAHRTWTAWHAPDRGLALRQEALQVGLSIGVAEMTKRLITRDRPNHHDLLSFPSEHTMLAAVSTCEAGRMGILIPATAYLRIASGWHFLTDTLAGAAVGCAIGHWVN